MTTYICVVNYATEDEDPKTYVRISDTNRPPVDVEVSPVQMITLAADLLNHFPKIRVD